MRNVKNIHTETNDVRPVSAFRIPHSAFAALLCALLLSSLAACTSNDQYSSRDFNELIPRMMGAMKQTTPTEAAGNLFNVTSPDERRDAVAWLQTKKYGHQPPYMAAYKLLTTDPSPMVRAQTLRALGSSHDYSIVSYLVKGLDDKDVTVRRDAAWGLQTTCTDEALDALSLRVKEDEDDQVRINAATALRWTKNPKAILALIDALDDTNAAVQFNAHQSLKFITGQDLPIHTKQWLPWYRQTYETVPTTTPKAP